MHMKVKDIMSADVVVVEAHAKIREIAQKLTKNGFTGMPVVEGQKIIGIVTEDDLVAHESSVVPPEFVNILSSFLYLDDPADFEEDVKKVLAVTAEELMTKEVISISPEASIEELATLFKQNDINPVPVEADGKLVGIVSKSDIVALLTKVS